MRDFALEVYFSKWEFAAKYNLAGSDGENMTLAEPPLAPAFLMRLCSFCVTPQAGRRRRSRFLVNPNLKIQLNAGYFDLATPFYQGVYEMHHLPIPANLQANIEYKFYDSGHMVYAKDSSLKLLHENVAGFIRRTNNLGN
jgi:hypothetical protein